MFDSWKSKYVGWIDAYWAKQNEENEIITFHLFEKKNGARKVKIHSRNIKKAQCHKIYIGIVAPWKYGASTNTILDYLNRPDPPTNKNIFSIIDGDAA